MSTFHLPPTHCSVVLMSDNVTVACLSSRTVLVRMCSLCQHVVYNLCTCEDPVTPVTIKPLSDSFSESPPPEHLYKHILQCFQEAM